MYVLTCIYVSMDACMHSFLYLFVDDCKCACLYSCIIFMLNLEPPPEAQTSVCVMFFYFA